MDVSESDLRMLVRDFAAAARPKQNDPSAPATVAELNNLVTQMSATLDALISKLVQ